MWRSYGRLAAAGVESVVQVKRLLSLLLLVLSLAFPAGTEAQTYGSGELEYMGIRLTFSGQISGGTCQSVAQNVVRCQVHAGASGAIQLTAVRTPAGAVNIRAASLPSGWPAFSAASGWGTVSKRYTFTLPSSSAGQSFELRFSAWAAGVVGELQLTCIIDAVAPPAPTPPPSPTPPPTPSPQPSPTVAPRIEVVPVALDFGEVTVGKQSSALFRIRNTGSAVLAVSWVGIGITPVVQGPFSLTWPHTVPFSLSPGGTTAPFLVVFSPTSAGEFKDRVIINSNDPQRPQVEILVAGRGVSEPAVSPPPEEAPPAEDEVVPLPKKGLEKCQECMLGVLTHNCQLIPAVPERWCPHRDRRSSEIAGLVAGRWAEEYHVICLQEVFSYEGRDFRYKNAIARAWLSDESLDLGAEREVKVGKKKEKLKTWWHKLEKDGKHQDQEIEVDGQKVRLLARNPGDESAVQQIAVLKKGDRYLVTGPDSPSGGNFSVDAGLMILSRYPLVAVSGFTFSERPGMVEGRSNKGALYARIQLPGEPECFIHVFNTHLASGDEEEYWQHRSQQLKELGEFINRCVADATDHPMVVCGDFNVDGYCGEYNRLMGWCQSLDLEDAWREKNQRQDPPQSPYDDPRKGIPWYKRQFDLEKGREYRQWQQACEQYKNECDKYRREGKDEATWVGKGRLKDETPWGEENVLAAEKGNYLRLDYIFYCAGSAPLKLVMESISREPAQKRAEKYPWGGYTVSDHLGVGAQFKVLPVEPGK